MVPLSKIILKFRIEPSFFTFFIELQEADHLYKLYCLL